MKRTLLKNVAKNVSEDIKERRSEYKSWNRKVKDLVNESKRKVDEEFGRKLSEKLFENEKLFCKEVKRKRGGVGGMSVRVKREDGVLVSSREEVKEVWKRHFECLMNAKTEGEAVMSSMGMEPGEERV